MKKPAKQMGPLGGPAMNPAGQKAFIPNGVKNTPVAPAPMPALPTPLGGKAVKAAGQKAAIPSGMKVGKGARKGKMTGGY